MNAIKQKLWALRSRTVRWFLIYGGIAWAALPQLQDALPQLQPYLPDNIYKWLSAAFIVMALVARAKTTGPLSDHKG